MSNENAEDRGLPFYFEFHGTEDSSRKSASRHNTDFRLNDLRTGSGLNKRERNFSDHERIKIGPVKCI